LRDLNTDDPTPGVVGFHMQQCVAKHLKAFLVFRQVPFHRSHDIAELIELCRTIDSDFESLNEVAADSLSYYSVEVAELSFASEPSSEDAKFCCEIAGQGCEFVVNRLVSGGLQI